MAECDRSLVISDLPPVVIKEAKKARAAAVRRKSRSQVEKKAPEAEEEAPVAVVEAPKKSKHMKLMLPSRTKRPRNPLQTAEAQLKALKTEEMLLVSIMAKLQHKKRQLLIENDRLQRMKNTEPLKRVDELKPLDD